MGKQISNEKVMKIIHTIAKGKSITETAKKFGIAKSGVDNIVRGVTHCDASGLKVGTEASGTRYIRSNKDVFVIPRKVSTKPRKVRGAQGAYKTHDTSYEGIMRLVRYVAEGYTMKATAEKFGVRLGVVTNIVAGESHVAITGLNRQKKQMGTKYIRANREMFMPNAEPSKTLEEGIVIPAVEKGVAVIAKESKNILMAIEMSMATVDKRMKALESQKESLMVQKKRWEGVTKVFKS